MLHTTSGETEALRYLHTSLEVKWTWLAINGSILPATGWLIHTRELRTSAAISAHRDILLYTLPTEAGVPSPRVNRIPKKTLSASSSKPAAWVSQAIQSPRAARAQNISA